MRDQLEDVKTRIRAEGGDAIFQHEVMRRREMLV
jgi:hypothetical protein